MEQTYDYIRKYPQKKNKCEGMFFRVFKSRCATAPQVPTIFRTLRFITQMRILTFLRSSCSQMQMIALSFTLLVMLEVTKILV